MKVDSVKKSPNGFCERPSGKPHAAPLLPCDEAKPVVAERTHVEGTTTNGFVSGENLATASLSSTYSVSDVDSCVDKELWSSSDAQSDAQSDSQSSDLDDIVTTGTDVCHAATLEAFLENLEFIPAEINRILKLIGTLDEKCEEIMEMLEHPCDDWFALHRTKKQKKTTGVDHHHQQQHQPQMESMNGDVPQGSGVNGSKELMVYRKIYEGQEGIGFETYKARLAKARRLERRKDIEIRANELISLPDSDFKIIYDANEDMMNGGSVAAGEAPFAVQNPSPLTQTMGIKPGQFHVEAAPASLEAPKRLPEPLDGSKWTKTQFMEKGKAPLDLIDSYFRQVEQDVSTQGNADAFMQLDGGEFHLEESSMGEDWKEKLDDILYENKLNQAPCNDMETLRTFMESQLTLLWRYTLRKKALTRKAYETILHHYASLVQELQPNDFGSSLKCYPEASVIQGAMLNELEEQFISPEEMTELYKDVEALMAHCDDADDNADDDTNLDDGYFPATSPDQHFQQEPPPATPAASTGASASVKHEETPAAPFFSQNEGRRLLMDESYRGEKSGTSLPRPTQNGTASVYAGSNGSAQPCARTEVPSTVVAEAHSRRVRNKRHTPAKAPSGLSHAAKSPQSTGRLLTYHDIATPVAATKLSGHPAELFWPDDDLWYLIHIDVINPDSKTANIVYTTGETETLELDDIVREGHMSLLPEAEDTDLSAEEDVPQQGGDVELAGEVISEGSVSEMRAMFLDDPSADEDELGSDDEEEEVMANIHRSRQSRRAELKAENRNTQQKSS